MRHLPPISAGTGWNSATRRRRPACSGPTAAISSSAWTGKANIAAFDGDGAQYAADVGDIEKNAGLLFGLLGGGLWTYPTFKLLAGEAWRRAPRGLAAFLGDALIPARGWLETSYKSDLSRALWAPWVLHAGLGPEDAFSGQIAKVIAFALEAAGAPIVKGGAKNLLAAFEALIREKGGEIRTGADVASVIVEGGRATGVRLASGETITATKERHLLGHADAALRAPARQGGARRRDVAATRQYRYGKGNFQIHYALDRPPAWRDAALGEVALLHLTPGLDGVSKACNEAARGMLPETPTICRGTAACARPVALPARQGDPLAAASRSAAPHQGRRRRQARRRPPTASGPRRCARPMPTAPKPSSPSHIDGFSATVLGRRAYSPADLEAMNINLVGGDPYGGSSTIDQSFLWRPFKSSRNHETSIKGLYHIGASTHPGAGLGGGSGFLLAQRL